MAEESKPPDVTAATLAEAQKVFGLEFSLAERERMTQSWPYWASRAARRRAGPELPGALPRAAIFDPRLPGTRVDEAQRPLVYSEPGSGAAPLPLPARDEDIAYASVGELGAWIRAGTLTSTRLTQIYLARLRRIGPELRCTVTLTESLALAQAARADRERAAGTLRGPLHGIPWGAKDLFDTAGIPTTWGVEPCRDRIPERDATVVERLARAGAVLVAKLSLGELAQGDVWFGGTTRSPWDPEQGASGSSAGSAAAVAAGLVGFALGTETTGSIESPCKRCGATGLRPTFGRVPRTGAMALCWSLDKVGPICRASEDTAAVLDAIRGPDPGDPSALDLPFNFDATRPVAGLRVGTVRGTFESERCNAADARVLEALGAAGVERVEFDLPDLPYDALLTILFAEAGAAFEEWVTSGRLDRLAQQGPRDWPNTLRASWLIPAVELVQAERLRRLVMSVMGELFADLDAIVCPHWDGQLMMITNHTGHPGLTLRTGFDESRHPVGSTIYGRLFDEGTVVGLGMALERELGVREVRPPV